MKASSHLTADGVELATWEWVGGRPEFLLVHGLASNARLWDGVARGLHRRGNGLLSVDLRGHGLSAKPSDGFEFETMAGDLAGLIEQKMSPPVIAAGQSFGGNLVLELAARHPALVSGVVCVDGGFVDLQGAWPDWNEALELLTPPPLDHLRGERLSTDAASFHPGWPEEGVTAQLANLEVHPDGRVTRRLALDSHLQILRSMWEQSPTQVAAAVKAPVLVLAADNGPSPHQSQVEGFVAALEDCQLHRMKGHHDLHAEQPDAVVQIVEQALDEGFLR